MELWNLPATNATFQSNVSLLDDAVQYPSCNNKNAVLVNTILNTTTVAYYIGTTPACFVCDKYSGYEPNSAINKTVCQSVSICGKLFVIKYGPA